MILLLVLSLVVLLYAVLYNPKTGGNVMPTPTTNGGNVRNGGNGIPTPTTNEGNVFSDIVYSGYTDEDLARKCGKTNGVNCENPNCKQGDGYCFCMINCEDSSGNKYLLYRDCSSSTLSSFDPQMICDGLGDAYGVKLTAKPLF